VLFDFQFSILLMTAIVHKPKYKTIRVMSCSVLDMLPSDELLVGNLFGLTCCFRHA